MSPVSSKARRADTFYQSDHQRGRTPPGQMQIARAERRIAYQRDVVEFLEAHGDDTTAAEDLVQFMTQALQVMKRK